MNSKLSPDYVVELIKASLMSPKILDICKQHLQYHFLENEAQKRVLRYIVESSEVHGAAPTIGTIGQAYKNDKDVISFLSRIKKANVTNDNFDLILDSFETYIKDTRFQTAYDHVGILYNEGKHEEAVAFMQAESTAINEFKLKDNYYTRVFADFEERQHDRLHNQNTALLEKCPWGIHSLDRATRGGINKGTSALVLGRSGGGKSTMMRWTGLCNARIGNRVVHFQAEGTKKDCLDAYDAGWTSISLEDMEVGVMPADKKFKIMKAHKDILAGGGEIFVFASEQFDSMTLNDCRDILIDIEKIYGKVDMVIFDYLELFNVKGLYYNSEQGERKRREDVANRMTNIAVEFNVAVLTATQANDVVQEKYNNPEWVMTRSEISEFKGAVKPFSQFITINQTDDEYKDEIVRLHIEKLRKYKGKKTFKIFQSLDNSRFYDSMRTINTFHNGQAA